MIFFLQKETTAIFNNIDINNQSLGNDNQENKHVPLLPTVPSLQFHNSQNFKGVFLSSGDHESKVLTLL